MTIAELKAKSSELAKGKTDLEKLRKQIIQREVEIKKEIEKTNKDIKLKLKKVDKQLLEIGEELGWNQ